MKVGGKPGSPVFAVPRPVKMKKVRSSMMMDSPMPKKEGVSGGMVGDGGVDCLEGIPCFDGKDNIKRITSHTVSVVVFMDDIACQDPGWEFGDSAHEYQNHGLSLSIRVRWRTNQRSGQHVYDYKSRKRPVFRRCISRNRSGVDVGCATLRVLHPTRPENVCTLCLRPGRDSYETMIDM
jgi:hypothetical protein